MTYFYPPAFASKRFIRGALLAAFALFLALLLFLPGAFLERAVRNSGNEFAVAQMTHHGDTAIFYLPRAREVIDGHFPALDLHVPANKLTLFVWPPGPQVFFAAFLRLFQDVSHAWMAAGFIFTLVNFSLFYWLGREFIRWRPASLFLAVISVFTPIVGLMPRWMFSPQLFLDIVGKNFIPLVHTPILWLARIEDPLLTFWLYLLTFISAYRFWREPTIKRGLALGASVGLLLYFYLYYWLFSVVLLGLLFGWDVFRNGKNNIRSWLLVIIVTAVFTLPYMINFLELRAMGVAAEQATRLGFEYGRGFRLSVWRDYVVYALLGAAAFFLLRRKNPKTLVFFIASLAALAILWNLQLFIGWNIQPDHWPKAAGLPLFSLLVVIAAEAVSRLRKYVSRENIFRLLAGLFIVLTLLAVAKKVVNIAFFAASSKEWIAEYSLSSPTVNSWRWLDQNAPPESVVLSNSFLTAVYLTGYTSMNPYLAFGQNTIANAYEVEERFLTVHKLFGTSPERLERVLTYAPPARGQAPAGCPSPCAEHTALNLFAAPTYLYNQTYNTDQNIFDALTRATTYAIPSAKMEELLRRYKAISPKWADFGGSYVYIGPWERELSAPDLRKNKSLDLVYDNGGIEIYRAR